MCIAIPALGLAAAETAALATAAASAASAAAAYQGQQNAADTQEEMNRRSLEQFAMEENELRMAGENQRNQEFQQSASEVNALEDAARRERASLDALLGEYGAGNTGQRRMAALGIQQGQDLTTLRDNATRRQGELGSAERADLLSIRSKMNGLPGVQRPSGAGLALGIGSAGLTLAGRMESIKYPRGRKFAEDWDQRVKDVRSTMYGDYGQQNNWDGR